MKTATGLVLWYMKFWGFYGWISAFGTLYALPGYETNPLLLKHEQTHEAQRKRDGWFMFLVKSGWYLLQYGYKDSPYEVEAINISGT